MLSKAYTRTGVYEHNTVQVPASARHLVIETGRYLNTPKNEAMIHDLS